MSLFQYVLSRSLQFYAKYQAKDIIKICVALCAFVLLIFVTIKLVAVPKTPATVEQVCDALIAQGYNPLDITEKYYESNAGFKEILTKSIAAEEDDIRFEFFVFVNKNSAVNTWKQLYGMIYKHDFNLIETDSHSSNYRVYTIDDHNTYSLAIYVENTVVYAYCSSENKLEINAILDTIGYLL